MQRVKPPEAARQLKVDRSGAQANHVLGRYGYLDGDFTISLAAVPSEEFSALGTIARGLKELVE